MRLYNSQSCLHLPETITLVTQTQKKQTWYLRSQRWSRVVHCDLQVPFQMKHNGKTIINVQSCIMTFDLFTMFFHLPQPAVSCNILNIKKKCFRPQPASSLKIQLACGDNKLLAGSVAVYTIYQYAMSKSAPRLKYGFKVELIVKSRSIWMLFSLSKCQFTGIIEMHKYLLDS